MKFAMKSSARPRFVVRESVSICEAFSAWAKAVERSGSAANAFWVDHHPYCAMSGRENTHIV